MMNDIWRESSRLIEHIGTLEPGTKEYDQVQAEIREFIHIENMVMQRPEWISWKDKLLNNQALVGGIFTLIATGSVLYFERLEIITSRAFGWIRPK